MSFNKEHPLAGGYWERKKVVSALRERLVGAGARQAAVPTGSCQDWAVGERKITKIRDKKRARVVEFFVHKLID